MFFFGFLGIGKMVVMLCYSCVVCDLMGLFFGVYWEIVFVLFDWWDSLGLLGYFNVLYVNFIF